LWEEREEWRSLCHKKIHPGGNVSYRPDWTVGDLADHWLSLLTWTESRFINQNKLHKNNFQSMEDVWCVSTGPNVLEKYLLKSELGVIPIWKVSMPNKKTLEHIIFKYS
jgi:hypothetical protein